MNLDEIENHWKGWAEEFKLDLRATTKTRTIKELEISALYRAFRKTPFFLEKGCEVLEVGCGNGHNCFSLSSLISNFNFTGVDFIPEMVTSANEIKNSSPSFNGMKFFEGNILKLDINTNLENKYHIIFTNRCLINLNTHELQAKALDQLYDKTADGGYIVIVENIEQSYSKQNQLRVSVGLKKRTPDRFNLFINEAEFISYAKQKLNLLHVESFASLHDIVLYVLVPMITDGNVDYEHPIVAAVTKLLLSNPEEFGDSFGDFGQNRLYVFKKELRNEQ
jgi:SAM-dependent methyltransferase